MRQAPRSANEGRAIADPEALAGLWEAPDGRGGFVGLSLGVDTALPFCGASTTEGAVPRWESATLGMYQRTAGSAAPEDVNFFTDEGKELRLDPAGRQIVLHSAGFDLDLHRMSGNRWVGRFHRNEVDEPVMLRPPRRTGSAQRDWVLGTWVDREANRKRVLHIGRGSDGVLLGWSDLLVSPQGVRCAASLPRPQLITEQYGELGSVVQAVDGAVSVNLGPHRGDCCPEVFTGRPGLHGVLLAETREGLGSFHGPWHLVEAR